MFSFHPHHKPGRYGLLLLPFYTEEMRSLVVKPEVTPAAKDRVSLTPKPMFFPLYGFTSSRSIKCLYPFLYTHVNVPAGVIFIVCGKVLPGELKRNRRRFLKATERIELQHVFGHFQKVQRKSTVSALISISCIWGEVSYTVFRRYSVASQAQTIGRLHPTVFVHNFLHLSDDSLSFGGGGVVFRAPGLHLIFESPGQNHF